MGVGVSQVKPSNCFRLHPEINQPEIAHFTFASLAEASIEISLFLKLFSGKGRCGLLRRFFSIVRTTCNQITFSDDTAEQLSIMSCRWKVKRSE